MDLEALRRRLDAALSRLGRIDERTLVIGLSAGRPHPLVVRAMKLARHRKARAMCPDVEEELDFKSIGIGPNCIKIACPQRLEPVGPICVVRAK